MNCGKLIRAVRTRKGFTNSDITAEEYLEDEYSLYGTRQGELFLYNYLNNTAQLIMTVQDNEIHSIVSYNREAFLGMHTGHVYVVNLINRTSAVLGRLQNPVMKVYIFGDGASRMIYAATANGRISAFEYSTARLSFGNLEPVVQNTVKEVKMNYLHIHRNEEGHFIRNMVDARVATEESSDSQDTQSTPSSLNLLALDQSISIKPVWTTKFKNAKPTFLHGLDDVLAFCSEDGAIRFFSLMNFAKMLEFTCVEAHPMCCHMHRRTLRGESSLFCVAGYSSGEVYTICINNAEITREECEITPAGEIRAIYFTDDKLFVCDNEHIYVFTDKGDIEGAHQFRRSHPHKLEFGESERGVVLCLTYSGGQCGQVSFQGRFEETIVGK